MSQRRSRHQSRLDGNQRSSCAEQKGTEAIINPLRPPLCTDAGAQLLRAGDAAAFPKNQANGHHLINRGQETGIYLEIGSRHADDVCTCPDVDLHYAGGYTHKDGTPYR